MVKLNVAEFCEKEIKEDDTIWESMGTVDSKYVKEEDKIDLDLDRHLTVEITGNRLVLLAALDFKTDLWNGSKGCYMIHLDSYEVEVMPKLIYQRSFFSKWYKYSDQFIYLIGG